MTVRYYGGVDAAGGERVTGGREDTPGGVGVTGLEGLKGWVGATCGGWARLCGAALRACRRTGRAGRGRCTVSPSRRTAPTPRHNRPQRDRHIIVVRRNYSVGHRSLLTTDSHTS